MAATTCERARPPPRPSVPPGTRRSKVAPPRPAPPRCLPLKSEPPQATKPTPAVRKSHPPSTLRPSTLPRPRRQPGERHAEGVTSPKAKDRVCVSPSSLIVSREHRSKNEDTSRRTNRAGLSCRSAPGKLTRQSITVSKPSSEAAWNGRYGRATVDDMLLGQRRHPKTQERRPMSASTLSLIPPRDRLRAPRPPVHPTKPPRPPPPRSFGGGGKYVGMDDNARCNHSHVNSPSAVVLATTPHSGEQTTLSTTIHMCV